MTGGSGYVGNYIMKNLAKTYPSVQVIGMSRSGKAREPATENLQNVSYVRGNCLEPATFQDVLSDVDAVVHTVGTLLPSKTPGLSYREMNRDAAVNMARALNSFGTPRNFVMISSERAPPFLDEYLTTKIEAENFVINECEHIKPTMLRPGFVVDREHRIWSPPLGMVVDLAYILGTNLLQPIPVLGQKLDFLIPARSIPLSVVCHFAIEGAMGKNEHPVVHNSEMYDY